MRRWILLPLLALAATGATASNRFVEDLETRRAVEPDPGRRVDLLLEEALWWREIDLDTALERVRLAVDLAETGGDGRRSARALFQLAFLYGVLGQLDDLHAALERAAPRVDGRDTALHIEHLMIRGLALSRFERQFSAGYPLLRQALDLGEDRASDALLADVHTALVWHFYFSDQFGASLSHALIALELTPARNDYPLWAPRQRIVGSLYARLESPEAVPHWERALALYDQLGLHRGRALLLANFGDFQRRHGELEEALHLLRRAAAEPAGDLEPYVLRLFGRAFDDAGQHEEALRRFEEAIAHYQELDLPYGFHETRAEMAASLAALDRVETAIELLEASHHWASEQNDGPLAARLGHELAYLWQLRGDPALALASELAADRLEGQLAARQRTDDVARAQRTAAAYRERRRLAAERRRQAARARRQEVLAVAGTAVLVLLAAGTGLLYRGRHQQRRAHRALAALQTRTEKALSRAERLNDEKNRLIQIIAHDLRGPLLALRGHAERVRRELDPDRRDPSGSFGYLMSATDELTGTLESLLGWALDANAHALLTVDCVELATVLSDAVETAATNAERKGICLDAHLPDGVAVLADRRALVVVVRNLLSNAIKYTPAGGSVSLEVEDTADRALIRVRDTGVGLDREQLARLFDPANAPKSTRGTAGERGVGLGLRLVRQLLEEMGGSLEAESEPDQGSEFRVLLRRSPAVEP